MRVADLVVLVLLLATAGCNSPSGSHIGPGQCQTCHVGEKGFSPFHAVEVIGCASCHLGNPEATTLEDGHNGMIVVPGNLDTAAQTCGASGCHPEWVERVQGSLMATGRGIVAVDRWAFGESESPDGHEGFADLGQSPADTHLRQLCMSCHLGTPKTEPGPLTELSRGGGCLACHLSYPDTTNHAQLTMDVPDSRCEGCHSRSGRISLNAAGWHETTRSTAEAEAGMRVLADGRVLSRQPADVHHVAGMACVDCHTAYEVMGDGNLYTHQEQATEVSCITCHEALPDVPWSDIPSADQKLVLMRTGIPTGKRQYARSEISGRAITNVFSDSTLRVFLQSRLGTEVREILRPPATCALEQHERVSCQSCHSSWVPQCLGCHTQQTEDGEWVELIDEFRADPPILGVRTFRDPDGRIEPFTPGMIMTLAVDPVPAHSSPSEWTGKGVFKRLYAPAVPHTTARSGRTCMSCHLDPLALGFGRGTLKLTDEGAWTFSPQFADLKDGLPADAWIEFPSGPGESTRSDARPLNPLELDRIMRVGACLTCHPSGPSVAGTIYEDFSRSLSSMSPECVNP